MPRTATLDLSTGVQLEYEEHGSGERALVLVHGFTGSRDDWREQLPELAELGRTIGLDQRGHGGSTNTGDPASYSLDQLTEDLALALDALDTGPCDLLGHSLGGMVTLRVALAHPERVSSLILMDTAARGIGLLPKTVMEGSARLAREAGMGSLARIMREDSRKNRRAAPAALAAMDAMGFDRWWDRIEAKLANMDPEAFAALGLALGDQESLLPRLGEIACPTTIIVGEQDVPLLETSKELARGIPGAHCIIIPDAAHSPQLENREPWLRAVKDHLTRARSGVPAPG